MRSMTRAHLRANWSGVPSFSQLLLAALLRAFAMLVLYAASIVGMRLSLLSGECHTEVEPETLPALTSGILMETEEAAESRRDLLPSTTTIPHELRSTTILPARRPSGRPGPRLGLEPDSRSDDDDDSVRNFSAKPDSQSRFRFSVAWIPIPD
jgi:hypothetical protein